MIRHKLFEYGLGKQYSKCLMFCKILGELYTKKGKATDLVIDVWLI